MSQKAQKAKGWLVGIAVLSGIWLVQNGSATQLIPPQPSTAQAFAAGPQLQPGSPVAEPLRPSAPVRIRIPSIDVDAPMTRLGLGADGSLDVPPAGNRNIAGWYKDGVPPGAKGTAIVAGHVDNARGPSVFYALGALKKGTAVEVVREDGRTAVFSIDAIEVYESEDFPDQRVYGDSPHASLRLITCGGGFSKETGYQGNVVAYAHLTEVR
ncbi:MULTISPECIES: class F sortase [unclassified Streptomyces]|uniref:class F sortase n=1 Tax=unclassified Streptomyces TaxID=2593676 RepID=UPI00093FDF56|nr:class F sortase [Streptomyces sp. TSRI0281]OKI35639.1 class F sortase [Streptomyces sp. TSRI0281]